MPSGSVYRYPLINNGNPEQKILTVSQLNRESRFLLEKHLSTLWVEGEISNLSRPASGHIYFTLKDEGAQIRCAMFRNRLQRLRFRPENGQQVQIRGTVSLYEARGDYQLIAEHIREGGEGALRRSYERLKKRLQQEGLFNEDLKQPLPAIPGRLGIITSPSGAAIHDILSVLQRRFPSLPITIYPTAVQGEGAAQKIVTAIGLAEQRQECDLLILARGGGSMEDLWSFNEPEVAYAIHQATIPMVSAVGHETDFTIADHVADLRAPTPSAAAETISPDQRQWLDGLEQFEQQLTRGVARRLQQYTLRLDSLQRQLRHPRERFRQLFQRLDEFEQRLLRAQQWSLERHGKRLQQLRLRLEHHAPRERIAHHRHCLQSHQQQIMHTMRHRISQHQQQLSQLSHTLDALSPLAVLGRGYSITFNAEKKVIQSRSEVSPGDTVETRLNDGSILSQVLSSDDS